MKGLMDLALRLVNAKELATELGVAVRTIYRWRVEDPTFPCYRLGPAKHTVRYNTDEVLNWMTTSAVKAEERRGRPRAIQL